jgi:hypothetical protein
LLFPSNARAAGLPAIQQALAAARHLLEMHRRDGISAKFGPRLKGDREAGRQAPFSETAYAGVIEIDWTMVQGISSDQVLQFSMEAGMVLTGTVRTTEQGCRFRPRRKHRFCRTM